MFAECDDGVAILHSLHVHMWRLSRERVGNAFATGGATCGRLCVFVSGVRWCLGLLSVLKALGSLVLNLFNKLLKLKPAKNLENISSNLMVLDSTFTEPCEARGHI